MSKGKILVVEDFESIREYLCKFLVTKGYQTVGAENGQQALNYLSQDSFNLIISDYNMPEVNGMQLLEAIKANTAMQSIPMILLTSEKCLDKMKAAREAGLFAWIVKPYKIDNFISTIERALAREGVSK
ncbi:MAG: response regulator [Cyclobacteriaceae bacterium]